MSADAADDAADDATADTAVAVPRRPAPVAPAAKPPAPGDFGPGSVVDGWRVEHALGAGGFGTVYRVRHEVDGRAAALKVLHASLAQQPGAVQRFLREVDAVRAVRHDGLCEVLAAGRLPDRRPYLLLELLAGEDLQQVLRRGRLTVEQTLDVLTPLCAALAAAHAHGVVHRDVKPSNIFLARRPGGGVRVVLLDFGVAKLTDTPEGALTVTGQKLGTPCCMAPEQITGGRVDARTDVYGLGVLLHLVLTGRRPYAADSPSEMHFLQRCAVPPRPSEKVPLPPAVDDVVLSALAVDPAARPAGPLELLAALRAAASPSDGGAWRARGRAVAVLVEAIASHGTGDDDAVIDDADAVLARAGAHFSASGLSLVLESSQRTVLVRLVEDGDDDGACARVSAAVDAFEAWLAGRPGASPAVRVRVASAIGEAVLEGGRLVGGDLFVD